MVEINGIAHLFLTVSRFEQARNFYRELLTSMGMVPVIDADQMLYCVGGRTAVGIEPVGEAYTNVEQTTGLVLLALIGGVAGMMLGAWTVNGLQRLLPADLARFTEVRLNPSVFAFTFGLTLLTGLIFGVAPALAATRGHLQESLKEGMRLKGKVTSIQSFGAFVQAGGIEGLLPISELSYTRVAKVSGVRSALLPPAGLKIFLRSICPVGVVPFDQQDVPIVDHAVEEHSAVHIDKRALSSHFLGISAKAGLPLPALGGAMAARAASPA